MRVRYLPVVVAGLAVALVAGCGSTVPRLPDDKTIRINLMLDEAWRGYPGEPRRCLPTAQYSNVDVVSDRYLVFRGRTGSKAWLNKLRHSCPGLRRNDTLLFELHGARACNLDRVSVIDRFVFWKRVGPTCPLGKFTPIPPNSLERIDDLLRSK